ncbi:hypothetical protein EDB84DRAFT_1567167 [Lactarius hengduanensis]|nr:hypothetical protein EDB84DRAFT_1567167 [Lactarius hengduanensis]
MSTFNNERSTQAHIFKHIDFARPPSLTSESLRPSLGKPRCNIEREPLAAPADIVPSLSTTLKIDFTIAKCTHARTSEPRNTWRRTVLNDRRDDNIADHEHPLSSQSSDSQPLLSLSYTLAKSRHTQPTTLSPSTSPPILSYPHLRSDENPFQLPDTLAPTQFKNVPNCTHTCPTTLDQPEPAYTLVPVCSVTNSNPILTSISPLPSLAPSACPATTYPLVRLDVDDTAILSAPVIFDRAGIDIAVEFARASAPLVGIKTTAPTPLASPPHQLVQKRLQTSITHCPPPPAFDIVIRSDNKPANLGASVQPQSTLSNSDDSTAHPIKRVTDTHSHSCKQQLTQTPSRSRCRRLSDLVSECGAHPDCPLHCSLAMWNSPLERG